ncbi:hypothetical protein N7532_005165 [Penicillium argentinense]|uniref:GED domain-containing protein n=1 Tax=Penicillium argentinense TaxID=1131581 RepID=A0A9W9FDM1_9EURO|nr:uncharacterized protein N7532_005165 [Penicillium argentinense]KAJ5098164.1 hypothetical protein N7532_005165 [Penicillium argentinense]
MVRFENLGLSDGTWFDMGRVLQGVHLSNEDQAVSDIHDILKAYYKVAMKRFMANVVIQVCERYILRDGGPVKTLSPLLVGEFEEDKLTEIAGENFATARRRNDLLSKASRSSVEGDYWHHWVGERGIELCDTWRVIGADSEVFALRWEIEPLMNLGNAISALVTSAGWSVAGREVLSRTFFATIMSAVMLSMGLMKVARIVHNPFSVAKSRADIAEVLADALISKVQGERPVTLIGYSLGSRLIFSCLQSLSKRGAYGLVESVIMMGSPIPSNEEHWRRVRSVVSGRVVNVYSENDSVLAFLYRTSSFQLGVAGLQVVENVPGVENLNEAEKLRHEEEAGVKDPESSIARETLNSREGFGEETRMEKQVKSRTEENMTQHRIVMMNVDDEDYKSPLMDHPGKHSAI